MLSVEISTDLEAQSLTLPAYALYLSTIPHLDRDGLIDAHPLKLAAIAAPMRYELRDGAASLINEWVEAGLVVRYDVSSRQSVLFFKGFRRHQQGMEYNREPASRFPPPPGWTRTQEGLIPDNAELCFRLAESFHPKSAYRRLLNDAALSDSPANVADTSRSVRDNIAPKRREENNDDDDVHTYIPALPGYGNGGDARGGVAGRLTAALAEHDDDELRIAADGIGSLLGLHTEFDAWGRYLSAATRQQLIIMLAWMQKWCDQTDEQFAAISNLPAVLRSKVKNEDFPGLTGLQIDRLANQVEDALHVMASELER